MGWSPQTASCGPFSQHFSCGLLESDPQTSAELLQGRDVALPVDPALSIGDSTPVHLSSSTLVSILPLSPSGSWPQVSSKYYAT